MNIYGFGSVADGSGRLSDTPLTKAGGDLGKDEFLQLLVTQLRHQDPLNPMEAEDFAAQLAQFSSLEQLIDANKRLDSQLSYIYALAQGINTTAALGVLGSTVTAKVDEAVLTEGVPGIAEIEVGGEGGGATLTFYDMNGEPVGSREIGYLEPGRHQIDLGEESQLPPGAHSYTIDLVDEEGESVPVSLLITAVIDGIRYGDSGPVLISGGVEIPLSSIVEVSGRGEDR